LSCIDVVDHLQKCDDIIEPQLVGARHEGTDVFRQASAAKAQPGIEEFAPNALVSTDCVGEHGDIGGCSFAHFGNRVDE